MKRGSALVLVAALASAAVAAGTTPAPRPIPYRVVAAYPHDPGAFTQGLVHHGGRLYESTGLRGRSEVRVVELETGRILRRKALPAALFGEGLARVGGHLYQLTWTSGRGFIHRLEDLAEVGRFRYPGQGWGLAFDGELLWKSDGSAVLEKRSPFGFRSVGRVEVRLNGAPLANLNELEFVDGVLFANVWRTDRIVRIDPASGAVTGWLELAHLLSDAERSGADVLNGIAWDPSARRLLVTGKLWPKLFALELEPASASPGLDSGSGLRPPLQ